MRTGRPVLDILVEVLKILHPLRTRRRMPLRQERVCRVVQNDELRSPCSKGKPRHIIVKFLGCEPLSYDSLPVTHRSSPSDTPSKTLNLSQRGQPHIDVLKP